MTPDARSSLASFAAPLALAASVAAATLVARPAHAQMAMDTPSALEMRKQFVADLDTLQSKVLALAEAFPADKYAWRPAPGVRSVGEAFMHIASEYYVFTPMAYGATPSPVVGRGREAFQKFEANSTKDSVVKHLRESFAYTRQALLGLSDAQITGAKKLFGSDRTIVETSLIMSGDLHEHLGQLIAYARMNGVKPPWSR